MGKKRTLAVPVAFERQALAMPELVDKQLAELHEAVEVKELMDKTAAMAQFAARIKADTRITNSIEVCKLKIVAKYAELCPKEKGGRGKKVLNRGEEFSPQTMTRYRKVEAARDRIDEIYAQADADDEELSISYFLTKVNGAHVGNNTGNNEWYTPLQLISRARAVMGEIDLDPASSEDANEQIEAERFFSEEDDGLAQEWGGRLWMNPPYAMPLIEQFCEKLTQHSPKVREAMVLTNNGTETKWGQMLLEWADAVCFPSGRIKFWAPDESRAAPLQGQMICYKGKNVGLFHNQFGLYVGATF